MKSTYVTVTVGQMPVAPLEQIVFFDALILRFARVDADLAPKVDPFTRAHQNAVPLQSDMAACRQVTVESRKLFELPVWATP